MPQSPVALTVRFGCELSYFTNRPTAALISVRPVSSDEQTIQSETYTHEPWQRSQEEIDSHGNRVDRIVLQPGTTVIRHDAMVQVSSTPEPELISQRQVPVEELPLSLLRYTLPSRYCDSDRLNEFARDHFDSCEPRAATVRAIGDWVHNNIEYRFGAGSRFTTAADVIGQGYGVCRDFAHTTIALCQDLQHPRPLCATSHLADIADQGNRDPDGFSCQRRSLSRASLVDRGRKVQSPAYRPREDCLRDGCV